MSTGSRHVLGVSTLFAAALLVVGCSISPADTPPTGNAMPTSSATPDDSSGSTTPDDDGDMEAAWLDEGRMFAIVTQGSSTCVPVVDEISAEGQSVTVTLVDPPSADGAEKVCTADLTARASIGGVPQGVDPMKDVEFTVMFGDVKADVDLDGNSALTGMSDTSTEFVSSAGWFDDEGIVLLTWGSSTCPPIVESVEEQQGGATVTFAAEVGNCTSDLAPRATVLAVSDSDDDGDDDSENEFVLTLVGGNLDGTIAVVAG